MAMKIKINENALIFGLLWWLYKQLYIESIIIIIVYCSLFIIIEYLSNLINTYEIIFVLIKIVPFILMHIIFSLIADKYINKKNSFRSRIVKFVTLIIGIIIFGSLAFFISYLFERNILNIMKGQYFEKLLLAKNKDELLHEINGYGFVYEKRSGYDIYLLDYKGNKTYVMFPFPDENTGFFSIVFEYENREYYNKEIMPLLFIGKKNFYDINLKTKWINSRYISISYGENRISILSGYY
jgi:hypothetical protein